MKSSILYFLFFQISFVSFKHHFYAQGEIWATESYLQGIYKGIAIVTFHLFVFLDMHSLKS